MKLSEVLKLISIHVIYFIVGSIVWVLSFHSPLYHSINVFFYRGILLLITDCFLMAIFMWIVKRRKLNDLFLYRDIVLSITLIFSVNIIFFTHVPVTADRSVSIFILGYFNKNCEKSLSKEEVANFFTKKYIVEYGAIERRLSEQIATGDIEKNDFGYSITERGKHLMKIYEGVTDIFGIDKKFVSPKD